MSLHITSNTKSARLQPNTLKELRDLVVSEIEEQGPDADLNFIDTSLITDMTDLFVNLPIHNIKIDKWNTSRVTITRDMFYGCTECDTDISMWDMSNIKDASGMFYMCSIPEHKRPDLSAYRY